MQLTRMALVFTAIADSTCTFLLAAEMSRRTSAVGLLASPWLAGDHVIGLVIALILVSVGLYGWGMSLNDIIDRRRDSQVAAHRPLPSGRIGVLTAHLISFSLIMLALIAGTYYSMHAPPGFRSLLLIVWTAVLISFYDLAGKYLVAPGLLTLGLIRFFHALIPAPHVPLLWHPLLLLNHVTILSTIAYRLEEKRPPLTRLHTWSTLGGLLVMNLLAITLIGLPPFASRPSSPAGALNSLSMASGLLYPLAAVLLFFALALAVWRKRRNDREAGQSLMLLGLLWLIVYDAAFVAGFVSLILGAAMLLLLPIAWWSVHFMRWWSKVLSLSHRPKFQRIET